MGKQSPGPALRAQLRDRIINRIAELKLEDSESAGQPGVSPGQMSRLAPVSPSGRCEYHLAHESDGFSRGRLPFLLFLAGRIESTCACSGPKR
jgi:hypothetical protein